MKKATLLVLVILFFGALAKAQSSATTTKKLDLTGRAADHLVIQFGSDTWLSPPDSIKTGNGFARHFNVYFMYDKPFSTNPKLSVAYGGGIGTSNMFMDNSNYVNLAAKTNLLPFSRTDTVSNLFDKHKVTTIFLQAPLELRYYSNPTNPNKSWKLVAGVKIGTLIKAYTKSKNLKDVNNNSVFGKTYVQKIYNKRYFNQTDVTLSGRVGYGAVSLAVGYTLTPVLRDGFGASFNKLSIGLTISGL